ncbi:hypothetical protein ACP70R_044143 [Stipagrostis hirtigluma subsp. patula]
MQRSSVRRPVRPRRGKRSPALRPRTPLVRASARVEADRPGSGNDAQARRRRLPPRAVIVAGAERVTSRRHRRRSRTRHLVALRSFEPDANSG